MNSDTILLCDVSGAFRDISGGDPDRNLRQVDSPVRCLDLALSGRFNLVAVNFSRVSIAARESLIDLCAVLGGHEICVLAIFDTIHRILLTALRDTGTYAALWKQVVKQEEFRPGPVEQLVPASVLLAGCCPNIHYLDFQEYEELTVCGACLNRLVLGSRIIESKCTRPAHAGCQYFRNPRVVSS